MFTANDDSGMTPKWPRVETTPLAMSISNSTVASGISTVLGER